MVRMKATAAAMVGTQAPTHSETRLPSAPQQRTANNTKALSTVIEDSRSNDIYRAECGPKICARAHSRVHSQVGWRR